MLLYLINFAISVFVVHFLDTDLTATYLTYYPVFGGVASFLGYIFASGAGFTLSLGKLCLLIPAAMTVFLLSGFEVTIILVYAFSVFFAELVGVSKSADRCVTTLRWGSALSVISLYFSGELFLTLRSVICVSIIFYCLGRLVKLEKLRQGFRYSLVTHVLYFGSLSLLPSTFSSVAEDRVYIFNFVQILISSWLKFIDIFVRGLFKTRVVVKNIALLVSLASFGIAVCFMAFMYKIFGETYLLLVICLLTSLSVSLISLKADLSDLIGCEEERR